MKMYSLLISFTFLFCIMDQTEPNLPGMIMLERANDDCLIKESGKGERTFRLRVDKQITYSSFRWTHKDNGFIGGEYIKTSSRGIIQGNISKFDINGILLERIYTSKLGEIAWPGHPSPNDKFLLFTTHVVSDPEKYPFAGITPMLSLVIFDFENRKIVEVIDSIGRSPNFAMHESPWLYDESAFIYTLSNEERVYQGTTLRQSVSSGVYLYNMNTKESSVIVENGRFAIASPVNSQIAFIEGSRIMTMDLKDNSKKLIYEVEEMTNIENIHWTPNGNCIYVALMTPNGLGYKYEEILFDIKTGKRRPFMRIGLGFNAYTWI